MLLNFKTYFIAVTLFLTTAQAQTPLQQLTPSLKDKISAIQARSFLIRFESVLGQWELEDSAGEESVTEEQAAEAKAELCKLIKLKPCDISLLAEEGSALNSEDILIIAEIKSQPQIKSALIDFQNNEVKYFDRPIAQKTAE